MAGYGRDGEADEANQRKQSWVDLPTRMFERLWSDKNVFQAERDLPRVSYGQP
jgi:hypothetical protein